MPIATPRMTITLAPPPQGFNGTLAQVFQLIENNLEVDVPDGFLVGHIGSVIPPDNSGPWLKDGLTWYVWNGVAYVPQAGVSLIGATVYFAQATADLTLYVPCNGAAYPRGSPYDLLYAQIGTLYGAGDGATTFNVPNVADIVPTTGPHLKAWIRYA